MARKTLLNLIILLFSIILFQSCAKNENEHFIERQLETYFEEFSEEAQERGIEVDFDDLEISAYVENIEKVGTLGQCQQYSDGTKEVVIDENYWKNLSNSEKEFLVFHELGHCVLGRDHLDASDERGNCISIMQSGEGDCRMRFRRNNREEYLDELFEN